MEMGYFLLGGIGMVAFVFVMINKRSAGYRALLHKLENENNLIEIKVNALEEERNAVQANVAQLRGKVEAHEEAMAAEMRAISEAALQKEQIKAETFLEYLVRTGTVTKEHLAKVKAYSEKNNSKNSVEELLIMLDYVNLATLQQAKAEYDAKRMESANT